jgi:hypothetical protein
MTDLTASLHDTLSIQTAEGLVFKQPPQSLEAGPDSTFLVVNGTFTPVGASPRRRSASRKS